MIKTNFETLIWEWAVAHEINVHVASAIAHVESGLKPNVARHEPKYKWLFNPRDFVNHSNTFETETIFQKTSFGLFQMMGANFRELGFAGHFGDVFKPEIQLHYAMIFLKKLLNKYDNLDDMIASYNAGRPRKNEAGQYLNQEYVDKVKNQMLRRQNAGTNRLD